MKKRILAKNLVNIENFTSMSSDLYLIFSKKICDTITRNLCCKNKHFGVAIIFLFYPNKVP